jgi:hypothetical protein
MAVQKARFALPATLFLGFVWLLLAPSPARGEQCGKLKDCTGGECGVLYDADGNIQGTGACGKEGGKCQCTLSKAPGEKCKVMGGRCQGTCPTLYREMKKKGPVKGKCAGVEGCACEYKY